MAENALNKLFRTQSYYFALPSQGKYYQGGLDVSVDNEIGVMPMTASDEIHLKNPDTLFNGEGMYRLFESCVPGIANPKEIPIVDVDALLIAIRLAADDKEASVTVKCPQCGELSPYTIDLQHIMKSIKPKTFNDTVQVRPNVVVQIRPLTLESQVKTQIESFYQYQMQQALNNSKDDLEKSAEVFNQALASAIALQVDQVASNILKVTLTEDDNEIVVTDKNQILEWVKNMTKADHKIVSERIQELSTVDMMREMTVSCPSCNHSHKTKIDLNPANFF